MSNIKWKERENGRQREGKTCTGKWKINERKNKRKTENIKSKLAVL